MGKGEHPQVMGEQPRDDGKGAIIITPHEGGKGAAILKPGVNCRHGTRAAVYTSPPCLEVAGRDRGRCHPSSLSSCPLIACVCLPLAEPSRKPEASGDHMKLWVECASTLYAEIHPSLPSHLTGPPFQDGGSTEQKQSSQLPRRCQPTSV